MKEKKSLPLVFSINKKSNTSDSLAWHKVFIRLQEFINMFDGYIFIEISDIGSHGRNEILFL